jgi:hypothetical protein
VAAGGGEWTDNEERGVYKTVDGGKNWDKVLYVNARTGANDLVTDPADPNVLYATTWQRIRQKWNDPRTEAGYTGSGVHKTTDGGKTWTPINDGLPAPDGRRRIGIDVARSNPNVLYAFVDNCEIAREAKPGETDAYGRQKQGTIKGAEIYRSDNKGQAWKRVSESNAYMEGAAGTSGWVFAQVRVDPNNENVIYFLGLGLNQSTDGGVVMSYDSGRTWRQFLAWERISPDLTGNDPKMFGDIPYQTLFALVESPLRFGLLYAGTDDGRLHVTQNGKPIAERREPKAVWWSIGGTR